MLILAFMLFAGRKHDAVVEAAPAIESTAPVERVRDRREAIHDLVAEAQALLSDGELQYVFTGEGTNEGLRGRPVAFALWSETRQEWFVAHIEPPRRRLRWEPDGGTTLAFR